MPQNDPLLDLTQLIEQIIEDLNRTQADVLAKRIAATFTLGYRATKTKAGISDLQRRAVDKLAAEQLGYITEYNYALGEQLTGKVKTAIAEGKGYAEIKQEMRPYIEDVFGNKEAVTIDRRGQTRPVIEVDRYGKLHQVEKPITKTYSATTETYSDMLSRTVTHQAYEKGRSAGYQASGFRKWRFVGPVDKDRSRPWHIALVGNVYKYGTPESDMAESVLAEPNCRHRAIPFFEDPKLDTSDKFYDNLKDKAGLKYEGGEWTIKENRDEY